MCAATPNPSPERDPLDADNDAVREFLAEDRVADLEKRLKAARGAYARLRSTLLVSSGDVLTFAHHELQALADAIGPGEERITISGDLVVVSKVDTPNGVTLTLRTRGFEDSDFWAVPPDDGDFAFENVSPLVAEKINIGDRFKFQMQN